MSCQDTLPRQAIRRLKRLPQSLWNCLGKHKPFAISLGLAPYAVVVSFNDRIFVYTQGLVNARLWGIVAVIAVFLALLDYCVLDWVLRTKFLCGWFRRFAGIALYWVLSVSCLFCCMHLTVGLNADSLNEAGLSVAPLSTGWRYPSRDVLFAEVLTALGFVVFYDSLLKLASPAFSRLDYTVFHSANGQIVTIIDDCQASESSIDRPEDRERIRNRLLSLVSQALACAETSESLETDHDARECIRVVIRDLRDMAVGLRELEGSSLTKQQLEWQIWGGRPGRGECARNQRLRQLKKGRCPCEK
jgi:hypothetical protein